jgi:hypothetical protein
MRHVGEQQGVAVRRRFGSDLDAESATGAGTVVDNDRLAERFRQSLAEKASEHIRAAASRVWNDEADGTIGIWLGRQGGAGEGNERDESKLCRHCVSSCVQASSPRSKL